MKTCVFLPLLFLYFSYNTLAQTTIGRQNVDRYPITSWGFKTYGLTWLPADYNSTSNTYPLIIFLHAAGEVGDGVSGLNNLIKVGLPKKIAEGWNPQAVNPADGKTYHFIVVSPQAPTSSHWSYTYWHVLYILPDVIKRYRIDTKRIYIVGESAGGGGTWSCVTRDSNFTKKIAAIVPISATTVNNPSTESPNIKYISGKYGVKVWTVCGTQDAFYSVATSYTNTINSATPKPAVPAQLTGVAGYGHDTALWNKVLDAGWRSNALNLNLYEWMLQYQRDGSTSTNKTPVANAGSDKTITLPVNNITLSGSGSDAGGTVTAYLWSKISGPSQFTITSSTQAQTTVTNLVKGIYQFELKVTDNAGAVGKDTVSITVLAELNKPPVVDAGKNQSIKLPKNAVTLSGTAADSDGSIVSYNWKKIAGPDDFSITKADAAQTTVTGLTEGVYQFQFSAVDDSSATTKDTVIVTVLPVNKPPDAGAGSDKIITLPGNSITLKGTATDNDGTIVSYAWSYVDGPEQFNIETPSQAQTVINNLVVGTYRFELKVTDDDGASAADTVSVNVLPEPNKPPVVDAGKDQSIKLPKNSVTLTGTASDADGTIVSYNWRKIAGPDGFSISNADAAQTAVTGLTEGVYQFEFSAADDSSAIAKDTVTVTVLPVNAAPVADAGNNQTIALPNSVTLSGSATDADGTISSYQWILVNGPSVANILSAGAAKTVVNSLVAGVYQFELKATDDDGASGSDTVTITVLLVANKPPAANAGDDQTITLPWNTATLKGTGTDADGTIASFAWAKISGPSQYSIKNSNAATAAANNLAAGTYVFRLTVVDNSGDSSTDDVSIVVQAALTGYKTIPGKIEAESYNSMSGIKTEGTADTGGGLDVGWIDNGDWMSYSVYVDSSGPYTVNFRIAAPISNGQFQLRKADGTVLTTIDVPNTGNYQGWCTRSAVINLSQGYQTLRVVSTASVIWNLNWMEFVRGVSTGIAIPAKVQAEDYSQMSGIQMEPTGDTGGGLNVGWVNSGDWLDYNVNAATAGTYTVNLRLATPNYGASLQIRQSDGSVLATVNIPRTGGYQTWATVSTSISIPEGQQTLRVVCTSTKDWNINWIEFIKPNSLIAESSNNVSGAQQAAPLTATASFKIFPNPVADKFVLEVNNNSTGLMHVQVSSINGAILKEFTLNKSVRGTQQFNLSAFGLVQGTYIVHLKAVDLNSSQMIIKK